MIFIKNGIVKTPKKSIISLENFKCLELRSGIFSGEILRVKEKICRYIHKFKKGPDVLLY